MKRGILIEEMQRLWLAQLHREFTDICYQYDIHLVPPVFELSGSERQLGCWIPAARVIQISSKLIQNHSWDKVLMVLKHEMAHQVCSEVYGLKKSGHGRKFQEACAALGLPAPYNRSRGDLESVVAGPPEKTETAEGRRLLQRVKKLLALAGSNNEHEAASAMQRANYLLTRYNLDLPENRENSGYRRVTIDTRGKQMPTCRRLLCAILRDHFFVQVIFATLYDARQCCSYKTIELLGRVENVSIAEYCYHFLEYQLHVLWNANRHRYRGHARTARNSYYLGLLQGFAETMAQGQTPKRLVRESNGAVQENHRALTCLEKQRLQKFVRFHFPRIQHRSSRGQRIYVKPYEDAVTTGKSIVLQRTVTYTKDAGDTLFLC